MVLEVDAERHCNLAQGLATQDFASFYCRCEDLFLYFIADFVAGRLVCVKQFHQLNPPSDDAGRPRTVGDRAFAYLCFLFSSCWSARVRGEPVVSSAYCRAMAIMTVCSGETRWSTFSAAPAMAICTPLTRPENAFPRGP
jgi:hypothetical protein